MSISKKIIAVFFGMTALFWLVNFFIQKHVVLPSFADVERQHAMVNIERIEAHIQNEIRLLERLNYDWSAWDDTYDFVETSDQDYIDGNLNAETFQNLETDVVLILNTKQELVWGGVFEFTDEGAEIISTEASILEAVEFFSPFIDDIDFNVHPDRQVNSGVIIYGDKPVIYAIRPVLDSQSEGPARGFLLFGKTISEQVLASIQSQLRLDFLLKVIAQNKKIEDSEYHFDYISDDLLEISKTYFSNEVAVFELSTQLPREITRSGLHSVNYALSTLLIVLLISAVGISVLLNRNILRPLTNLKQRIQEIAFKNDYSLRIEVESNDEVGVISSELNHMLSIIEQNHKDLEDLTITDALTGVANRLALDKKLSREWNVCRRYEYSLAVLIIDIDHFKLFNDTYGHQRGDVCIRAVAQTIEECLKRSNDMVARFGGEEFVVVLPGHDVETAKQVAQLIQQSIKERNIEHEHSPFDQRLTLSIGIAAVLPSHKTSIDGLIKQADAALYEAKNSGRNCIKTAPDKEA